MASSMENSLSQSSQRPIKFANVCKLYGVAKSVAKSALLSFFLAKAPQAQIAEIERKPSGVIMVSLANPESLKLLLDIQDFSPLQNPISKAPVRITQHFPGFVRLTSKIFLSTSSDLIKEALSRQFPTAKQFLLLQSNGISRGRIFANFPAADAQKIIGTTTPLSNGDSISWVLAKVKAKKCSRCGKIGHTDAECTSIKPICPRCGLDSHHLDQACPVSENPEKKFCQFCKIEGHLVSECRKREKAARTWQTTRTNIMAKQLKLPPPYPQSKAPKGSNVGFSWAAIAGSTSLNNSSPLSQSPAASSSSSSASSSLSQAPSPQPHDKLSSLEAAILEIRTVVDELAKQVRKLGEVAQLRAEITTLKTSLVNALPMLRQTLTDNSSSASSSVSSSLAVAPLSSLSLLPATQPAQQLSKNQKRKAKRLRQSQTAATKSSSSLTQTSSPSSQTNSPSSAPMDSSNGPEPEEEMSEE